jgi:hypothetical protein
MFGRNKYQRFLLLLLIWAVPLFVLLGVFNYYIDPMWCFRHANRHNSVQAEIDDRQQKTNYLKFRGATYDTLIVGNSRVRMMDHNDFGPRAYNYAMAGMIPREYRDFIDYAKKVNGRDFKEIYLGLSFAHSNSKIAYFSGRKPSYYIEKAEEPLYRYTQLMSGDVFDYSFKNFRFARRKNLTTYFDRDNVQHVTRSRVQFDKTLAKDMGSTVDAYRKSYQYMDDYRSILESIKNDNPSTRITVFTTPVSQPLFCAMVVEGRMNDYKRWLRDIVDVYGEVHHFEYLTSVARDPRRYYMDGHHYYPETGRLLAHKMRGVPDPAVPADFGMVVNRSNIEEKLREIEAASAACREPSPAASISTAVR